ncbi:MAG TPA: cell division protein ZapA [Xanthomonadales bacterium]|nr:cell division protein ZapA [Xanthomonadales bacterium]
MSEPVAVHILDREYLVACTPEERQGLLQAAALLDGKMREIRNSARSAGLDRIAVMAALNLAHELIGLRQNATQTDSALGEEVGTLKGRLDAALASLTIGR